MPPFVFHVNYFTLETTSASAGGGESWGALIRARRPVAALPRSRIVHRRATQPVTSTSAAGG
jgi:hypothetical protein